MELVEELKKEDVALIEHDQQICNAIVERYYLWGQITRDAQRELMASYEKTEALDEQECYAEVRNGVWPRIFSLFIRLKRKQENNRLTLLPQSHSPTHSHHNLSLSFSLPLFSFPT